MTTRSFYISAAHKSSGKTIVTTGLARAFTNKGLAVQTFKKGPDYIDPLWLKSATNRPCWNLDFNTQSMAEIGSLFLGRSRGSDIAIVEGNKGLHDGTALDGSNSNAALATYLNTPVVLVVDTRGMTRGIAPMIQGITAFDSEVNCIGVILNRVGGNRHEGKLLSVLQTYTDTPVLGAVHNNDELFIDERHLGLIPSNEAQDSESFIVKAAEIISDRVDLNRLFAAGKPINKMDRESPPEVVEEPKLTIAIARDEAFGFYYEDDFDAFKRAGARCVFFDTLRDKALPACDGLFIGGGFPETRMDRLSANTELMKSIRAAIELGLPAYAECGGLMYLSEGIRWNGHESPMVGLIPGVCQMQARPVGRGYVRLRKTMHHPWADGTEGINAGASKTVGDGQPDSHRQTINAHEFHHSDLQLTDASKPQHFAYKVKRGHGINGDHDGIVINNLLANYTHFRTTEAFPWTRQFVDFVRKTAISWTPGENTNGTER